MLPRLVLNSWTQVFNGPPPSASQCAGITGMSYCTQPSNAISSEVLSHITDDHKQLVSSSAVTDPLGRTKAGTEKSALTVGREAHLCFSLPASGT